MFEVENETTGDNDQTKLIDLSSPEPTCTKKVSFCSAGNAKPQFFVILRLSLAQSTPVLDVQKLIFSTTMATLI